MTPSELRDRTTTFAAAVVCFSRELRRKPELRNIADQLSDSATAVAANYRCVTRARSRREFVSQLALVVQETDESVCWLEILDRSGTGGDTATKDLLREAKELLAILSAS